MSLHRNEIYKKVKFKRKVSETQLLVIRKMSSADAHRLSESLLAYDPTCATVQPCKPSSFRDTTHRDAPLLWEFSLAIFGF